MTSPIIATDRSGPAFEDETIERSAAGRLLRWGLRFLVVFVVYLVTFIIGGMLVGSVIPTDVPSDPGLVSPEVGILVIALANVLVIGALILTSRWHGWGLALVLGVAYYGVVTFLMQIETWYFLSSSTVTPEILSRLFLMGLPTAFVAVPVAVWVLGRGRAAAAITDPPPAAYLPTARRRLVWKVAALVVAYVALYFVAGYFIAWQSPELRAFYGEPADALPFLTHMGQDRILYSLIPFQVLRSLLWIACAIPIIWWSRVGPWWTAILVGLFFSVPQNVVHILANPLMPSASIRLTHLVETASSTFIFGMLVVLILHREIRRPLPSPR